MMTIPITNLKFANISVCFVASVTHLVHGCIITAHLPQWSPVICSNCMHHFHYGHRHFAVFVCFTNYHQLVYYEMQFYRY